MTCRSQDVFLLYEVDARYGLACVAFGGGIGTKRLCFFISRYGRAALDDGY